MGLRYSFILIARREPADKLTPILVDHVAHDDRVRLLAAASTNLEEFVHRIKRDTLEERLRKVSGDICLTFLFPQDDALRAYVARQDPSAMQQQRTYNNVEDTDIIPVGCVWTKWKDGKEFIIVETTAATSDMSRLFAQSTSVAETFQRIAQRAEAVLLLFDDESPELLQVWPGARRRLEKINVDHYYDSNFTTLDVDQYCFALLAAAASGPATNKQDEA